MSVTHFWFGSVAVNSRCKRLGATGWEASLRVVTTRRRFPLAHSPASHISRATRLREQLISWSFNESIEARTAVSALMRDKYLLYLFSESSIFSLMEAGRTLAPSIQATFRNFQDLAHHHDGRILASVAR